MRVGPRARTATLVLPSPRAASPRVDHSRTRLFEVRDEGLWVVVPGDGAPFSHPPGLDWSNLGAWLRASFEWMLSLGKPLAVGLVVLAVGLAIAGYVVVQLAWRAQVVLAWRRRRAKRAEKDSG